MKKYSYASIRHKANLADPYARIVEKNLLELINNESKEKIMENMEKYGKSYTNPTFAATIKKSSLDTRTFIRFMLATGAKEFTIKVTDEELLKIEEYEKQKNN